MGPLPRPPTTGLSHSLTPQVSRPGHLTYKSLQQEEGSDGDGFQEGGSGQEVEGESSQDGGFCGITFYLKEHILGLPHPLFP